MFKGAKMKSNLTHLVDELIKNANPISNDYDYDQQRYDWLEDSIRTLYIDYCMCLLKMDCKSLIFDPNSLRSSDQFFTKENPSNYIYDIFSTLLKKVLNHEGILIYVPETHDDDIFQDKCICLLKYIDMYFDGFFNWFWDKFSTYGNYDSNTMNW